MKQVSMSDFRRDAERIVSKIQRGERLILTRRGKAVARLEPIVKDVPDEYDSFYSLTDLADAAAPSLNSSQIDEIIFGK
jgi:antitoxin (DNA-binding transcriptional repressor) of toxin-antitoxin stability system